MDVIPWEYSTRSLKHSADAQRLNREYNMISVFRLCTVIACLLFLYFYFRSDNFVLIIASIACAGLFVYFMKRHVVVAAGRKMSETLARINSDEITFLGGGNIHYDDGNEYSNPSHPYSYDLDVFGSQSMFRYLNRTGTWIGKDHLARRMLTLLPADAIRLNQEAVKELKGKIDFRQQILARAIISEDSKKSYDILTGWAEEKNGQMPQPLIYFSYLSPLLLAISFTVYMYNGSSLAGYASGLLFFLNLAVLKSQITRIRRELAGAEKIHVVIRQHGLIIRDIENEPFKSRLLVSLQEKLSRKPATVSNDIKRLSVLFSGLDSIYGGLASMLVNGLFLYHVHILRSLLEWKKNHGLHVREWLDVTGEMEATGSIANFAFNNPLFVFPKINSGLKLEFKDLGHPLIRTEKRVVNDLSYDEPFIILTGSNMSGKSTFLRTIGINMVLGGAGAPVCATDADIHPLPVLVSMRTNDSLGDSESYFFAEVKRLKGIMDMLSKTVCFVILDEILKGTNSDDKRTGTLAVIKKIIHHGGIGAIATHDLEICRITGEYPGKLVNKCFEVEIIKDELYFDYKLRDGVCRNKSATFLMKKMKII